MFFFFLIILNTQTNQCFRIFIHPFLVVLIIHRGIGKPGAHHKGLVAQGIGQTSQGSKPSQLYISSTMHYQPTTSVLELGKETHQEEHGGNSQSTKKTQGGDGIRAPNPNSGDPVTL